MAEGAAEESDRATAIVERVLARRTAIWSGRLVYERTTGFAGNPESFRTVAHEFSMEGDTWARRFSNSPNARVNRDGALYIFHGTKQESGDIVWALMVRDPVRPLEAEEDMVSAWLCGTIWRDSTAEFLRKHVGQVDVVSDADNGNDDVTIELPVAKDDIAGAFGVWNEVLQDGGSIILTVSPAQGYTVRRCVYRGSSGRIACETVAENMTEAANGIFYPKHTKSQWYNRKGEPRYFVEFRVHTIELINQPIPEEDFSLPIPVGTTVTEARSSKSPLRFQATEDTAVSEIARRLDADSGGRVKPERSAIVYVVVAAFLMLVVGGYLYSSVRRSKVDGSM